MKPKKEKKPFVITKKMIIAGVAGIVALALIAVGIVVFLALSNNIDMNDYVTVKVEGYDGYGVFTYEIDYDKLISDVLDEDISKYSDKSSADLSYKDIAEAGNAMASYYSVVAGIKVDTVFPEGKSDGELSNNDVVKLTVSLDNAVAAKYNVDVKDAVIEHKVGGLGSAQSFNALEYVSATFSGYNGFGCAELFGTGFEKTVGTVKFTQDADDLSRIMYESENEYSGTILIHFDKDGNNLSNGDIVKIYVDMDSADDLAECGIILEGTEKELTVSGLKDSASFDVTSKFGITVSGINGNGEVELEVSDSETVVGDITFTTSADEPGCICYSDNVGDFFTGVIYVDIEVSEDDSDGLSNGDTVTITADISTASAELETYGVLLTGETKEVTVSGLGKYAAKLSDIDEDKLDDLFAECKLDLKNRLYDDWAYIVHGTSDTYEDQKIGRDLKAYKALLVTEKNDKSGENVLFLVLSVTLKDSSMNETVYYFGYAYENVAVSEFGTPIIPEGYTPEKSLGFTDYKALTDELKNDSSLKVEESK